MAKMDKWLERQYKAGVNFWASEKWSGRVHLEGHVTRPNGECTQN